MTLQAPLSVVDDNRKVVGALSVVGATIVKIVSKFQYYFPDFLKKNTRQRRRSQRQGEGCVCVNAGEAGRGRVARWLLFAVDLANELSAAK